MQQDDGHLEKFESAKAITEHFGQEMAERNADLIFRVGETVKVKGGDFRIKSIGRKFMMLEGLPGSRIRRITA